MPKGQMTGNPTNIVCWLVGGYYNETVWGIAYDRDNLLSEISITHYENPRAKAQGVTILGITHTGPDDVLVEETYELVYHQEQPPAFAVYICDDSERYMHFQKNPETWIENYKHLKGYDLANEHLDPTNMPGQQRVVEIQPRGNDGTDGLEDGHWQFDVNTPEGGDPEGYH